MPLRTKTLAPEQAALGNVSLQPGIVEDRTGYARCRSRLRWKRETRLLWETHWTCCGTQRMIKIIWKEGDLFQGFTHPGICPVNTYKKEQISLTPYLTSPSHRYMKETATTPPTKHENKANQMEIQHYLCWWTFLSKQFRKEGAPWAARSVNSLPLMQY